jgi:hypothetical protein
MMVRKAKEVFQPESLGDGVSRTEEKINPTDAIIEQLPAEKSGNWKKATMEEVASYEAQGVLIGFDPATMEVLIKE